MQINSKIEKAFGPTGTTAGIIIFIVGLGMMYYSFSALLLVVIGAFTGFTYTSTLVDFDKKQVRYTYNLFGMWPMGKWIPVEPGMQLGMKKSHNVWRTYSRGNQTLDIPDRDYRIILFDNKGREIIPLKKAATPDAAKMEMKEISTRLGIGMKE